MHYMGKTIEFDDNKCIKCTKCVMKCKSCSVNYLEIKLDAEGKKHLSAIDGKKCIHCGQCTLVCPVGAIRAQDNLEVFKKAFADKSKIFIVQAAPSVRASLGEGWKMEHSLDVEKKMNTAFRKLGFNKIFDVNFGADITTMVEAEELLERLNNSNAKLPMFTSCCHAWGDYVLDYHPELKEYLTTARSPHLHAAAAYKTWWAQKEGINPDDIVVVSVMPCTSKKEEILKEGSKMNGKQLVDYSLTVRDMIQLLKENEIDLPSLEGSEADKLGEYSGAAAIYGASGGVMESAAGRINTYSLWPFSLRELAKNSSWLEVKRSLTERMIYGCYPTVVNEPQYAREYLRDFVSSVLYKDLFNLAEMRKPTDLRKLVTYLAYNVGSEIKYVTVSNELGISAKTIERYVDLLQSCFIVRVVPSFSRNPQSEIKLGKKIYFIDNGIRNALISGGFNPFASRPDTGSLWENLFLTERLKKHSYSKDGTEIYFWRTRFLQEMDFVEVTDGKMKAFECKVTPRIRGKSVRAFKNAYPECPVTVASPENIEELDGI